MNEFYYTYMVITFAGISWASLELVWGEYIEQTKGNVVAMGFGWAVWLFMLGWGCCRELPRIHNNQREGVFV